MAISEKMEQMIQEVRSGVATSDAVQKVTGRGDAELRKEIRSLRAKAGTLEEKYEGVDLREAMFREVEEQCGGDCGAQFGRLSAMKKLVNLRNLKLSEAVLREQGTDVEFMRETIERAWEEEQRMVPEASPEELASLKEELAQALPGEGEDLRDVLVESMGEEEAAPFLKLWKGPRLEERQEEDFAVMLAAAILSEHPEASSQEAAAVAAIQTAQNAGNKRLQFLLTALPPALAVTVGGLFLTIMADLAGLSTLSGAFAILTMGLAAGSGLLTLLVLGVGAYEGVKRAIPLVQKAWAKCRPHIARVAEKVKVAVLAVAGVVVNKVFRPAIYWVSNTALPKIRESVIYPMKRRLEGLLEWFREKKDQLVSFVRNAAAPRAQREDSWQEEEPQLVFASEDRAEDNWVFAD